MVGVDALGKTVSAKTAQGELYVTGVCVSYTDRPTIQIKTEQGRVVSWLAAMCEVVECAPIDDVAGLSNEDLLVEYGGDPTDRCASEGEWDHAKARGNALYDEILKRMNSGR